MNHVFALVWNASLGCWAVTHEFSKRCRKGSRRIGKLALAALLLGSACSAVASISYWDGNQIIANGVVDGGSGAWSVAGTNWTD
ncbi:MAG: ESPR domain-containing protein, partial [Pseudomonas sp.]